MIWRSMGLSKLPKIQKHKLWDWMMQAPFDEVYLQSGWQIALSLTGVKSKKGDLASKPKYQNMTEEQRREYQRQVILKNRMKGSLWKRLKTKLGF